MSGVHPYETHRSETSSEAVVSVVIPCYNQARFLGDAIYSALHQTYPQVEVVVVDDGSSDGTQEVANWEGWDGAVRYVRQKNAGLSAARNTGLYVSTGEFVVFLDADDRLLPGAVKAGIAGFRECPESAFVFGSHRYINAEGELVESAAVPPALGRRLAALRVDHADTYPALLRGNFVGMHAAVMYRRALIEGVGGFDERLRACEDWDLYLRLARDRSAHDHGARVAEYRKHGDNMSHDPLLMLSSALAVLRAQRPWVGTDRQLQQAYDEGQELWQAYYGAKLAEEMTAGGMELGRVLKAGAVLLRLAPEQCGLRISRIALIGMATRHVLSVLAERVRHKVRSLLPVPKWSRHRQESRGAQEASESGLTGPEAVPAVGAVRFGDLRRVEPFSRAFGFNRGLPVDRYYIEAFLDRYSGDIGGRVLEIGDDAYTRRFGGEQVTQRDVLHVTEGNPQATFVGDLSDAPHLPSNAFDCILLTQTLHLIYDVRAALTTLHRILKPDGVLLVTCPGISQLAADEWEATWYWAFTARSTRRLFEEAFAEVAVETHGNVLAATAFLYGIAAEELEPAELDHPDPLYQMLITARAVKRAGP